MDLDERKENKRINSDSPKMDSPLSPLVGSSPVISGGPSKGLHRYGFKVVRKRRATVQETASSCAKHAGILGVHSLACSSPIRELAREWILHNRSHHAKNE